MAANQPVEPSLDAARKGEIARVDTQHHAGRPHLFGDVLGQKAGAAADIDHLFARLERRLFLRGFAEYRMILYSLLIIALMLLRPQGLFHSGKTNGAK